jgi:hypothetical protein
MKYLLVLLLAAPLAALADSGKPAAQRLFHIERNKNANIVAYDAMVLPDDSLAEDDPVVVYWLKLAEDGSRKDLKWIERKKAYGFDVKEREGNRLVLEMKADIGRAVVVDTLDGVYRAFADIGGSRAVLEKVFIFAEEGKPLPSVKYIELFGTDPATGDETYEKFEP